MRARDPEHIGLGLRAAVGSRWRGPKRSEEAVEAEMLPSWRQGLLWQWRTRPPIREGVGRWGPGLRELRPGPSRKQQAFRAQAWFDCPKGASSRPLRPLEGKLSQRAGLKARPRRVSQVRHEARALGGVRD